MRKLFKAFIFLAVIAILIYGGYKSFDQFQRWLYPVKYADFVEKYSKEFDVPEQLIFAVIKCESSFDPNAKSSVGARGLMQLLPESFTWVKSKYKGDNILETDDINNPEANIKYGTFLLSIDYKTFGSWKEAIAAYHAGQGNVSAWLENPEYSSDGKHIDKFPEACSDTESYVNRVLKVEQKYNELYYGKDDSQ